MKVKLKREGDRRVPYIRRLSFGWIFRFVEIGVGQDRFDVSAKNLAKFPTINDALDERDFEPLYTWCKVNGYPLPVKAEIDGWWYTLEWEEDE